MTTVSRVSQVSHTNVTGTADWDHRLSNDEIIVDNPDDGVILLTYLLQYGNI